MPDPHIPTALDTPAASTPAARLDAVIRALDASDTQHAVALADQALAAGDEDVLLLNLSAYGLEQAGRTEEAMTVLRRAMRIAPTDVLVLTAAGRTLSQLGREAEALVCFDAALRHLPTHAPAHHGRGLSLFAEGQVEAARRSHLRAADLDPSFADPLGALADHAVRDGKPELGRTLADRALALHSDQPAAAMVIAALDAKSGQDAAAIARIERLLAGALSPLHRAAAEQFLGETLDKLDRPVEAFGAFTRANALVRRVYAPLYEGIETAVPMSRRLGAYFAAARPEDWAAAPEGRPKKGTAPGGLGHVFLVGFVRSGTTLLEQVLASHPKVIALEEQATLRALTPEYFETDEGLDRLSRMGGAEADRLRARYWDKVRAFGVDPTGKVFIDKAPLSTLWLPMVAKLFPEAKVLLAIRDPRDVVLSAFRHRFLINGLTWPFTDLEDTAEFYSGLMQVAEAYRAVLPLQIHQHRHEDLVGDFDGEVSRICDVIGLEWTDSLRDFAETARRRDVRTPSAEQVRAGLNREGLGRWRRYGPGVAPILPILRPWIERYGYHVEG